MGEPALRAMTADEFLAWDDGTDTRHELVDGVIVAMAPPTDAHGTIAVNVGVEIADRLRARPPCRAIGEAGIRLDERNHFKADVAATCAEPRNSLYVEEPFLIVEVISESSERDDFGLKAHRYSLLPSVQRDLARRQPQALGAGLATRRGRLDRHHAVARLRRVRQRCSRRSHRA